MNLGKRPGKKSPLPTKTLNTQRSYDYVLIIDIIYYLFYHKLLPYNHTTITSYLFIYFNPNNNNAYVLT